MSLLPQLVGVILAVVIIGGGFAYKLWVKSRSNKQTWKAKVWVKGDGIRPFPRDETGKVIMKIKVKDLQPYKQDIIEFIDKGPGKQIYRLQKMDMITPPVTPDCVDNWSKERQEVNVLYDGGTVTLLKHGYNETLGNRVFHPMPHDRIQIITAEIVHRKQRLKKEKDILEAITPWIIAGICMVGLVSIAYIMSNGWVEQSKNYEKAVERMAELSERYERRYLPALPEDNQPTNDLGAQPAKGIPLIEEPLVS